MEGTPRREEGDEVERLEQEPDDLEGWRRLARSYGVLGELDKAAEAQTQIARLSPDDAQAQLDAALAHVEAARQRVQSTNDNGTRGDTFALSRIADNLFDSQVAEMIVERGDLEAARGFWTPLLDILPAESDIGSFLRRRMEDLDG